MNKNQLANKASGLMAMDHLCTSRECAAILRLSERTLFHLAKSGAITVTRMGKSVRYDQADIRAYIQRCKVGVTV